MLEDTGGNQFRMSLGGGSHAFQVFKGAAEGFFADDMFSGGDCIADKLCMTGMVGAYTDDIHIGCKQFTVVCTACFNAVFFAEFFGFFKFQVAQISDLYLRECLKAFDMSWCDDPAPDDASFEHDSRTFI